MPESYRCGYRSNAIDRSTLRTSNPYYISMPYSWPLASLEFSRSSAMVLCRAPLSLFIAPPDDNSVSSLSSSISSFHISSSPNIYLFLQRRSSKRGRIVCLSDGGFEASQSPKKNQLVVSITGATGFIGRRLVQKLIAGKRTEPTRSLSGQRFPEIVIAEEEEWNKCIDGSNVVVNLAGMPISTRWSSEVKKEIKQSRIKVTSKVVDLINKMNPSTRPSVLISATAIGYYGTSETEVFDERSSSGNDYLAEVCREWETKALEVDKDVRLLLIRIGVVLGRDGGALAKMIPLFMMFAGGPLGSGKQWFSWIHLDDLVSLIYEALRNPSYKGIINGTAPNPVRLSEMCDQLGQVMGRPSWLPVPDLVLKAVLGDGASIVLEGQKVLPVKAEELGFTYKYPFVKEALRDIISSGNT